MKKKYILLLASLAIGFTGCKKDFLNLQSNPNAPSSATPQFLLSAALTTSAGIINGDANNTAGYYAEYGVWAGYWISSGNYVPSPQLQQYSFTTDNYQVWTPLYNNLSNYHALITQTSADASLANYEAIAMIMTAMDFEALVDNYNNVPYSQAFQPTVSITPTYDKGSAIYDNLLTTLDGAISLINKNTSASSPGTSDIVFGGNMTEWKKFANTLKLRIALRQYFNVSSKDAALKASIAATASEGYIDGTFEADANPGYANVDASGGGGGQQSPFYLSYGFSAAGNAQGNNIYYRANNYAINQYKKDNDPRLTAFYLPLPNGTIAGLDFGTGNPQSNAFVSGIGNGLLKSPTMNAVIMSSSEALFLQAEAAYDGLITGTPETFYEAGITASFVAAGLTAAQATAYYTQPIQFVNWAASVTPASQNANPNFHDAKIQAIITQKWFALNGYGNFEAYNELRRTGYPAGVPSSIDGGAISPTTPIRVLYPTSEYSQNSANVAAQGTISPFTSEIFWMASTNFNTKQ